MTPNQLAEKLGVPLTSLSKAQIEFARQVISSYGSVWDDMSDLERKEAWDDHNDLQCALARRQILNPIQVRKRLLAA